MKIYLAGPMSGIPQFNYPAFMEVANNLRMFGYRVQNPAEMDDPDTQAMAMASEDGVLGTGSAHGETWGDFLARDVKLVADEVDAVALMPGWAKSRGARTEAYCALTVQKPVYTVCNDGHQLRQRDPRWVMDMITKHTVEQGDTSRYGG